MDSLGNCPLMLPMVHWSSSFTFTLNFFLNDERIGMGLDVVEIGSYCCCRPLQSLLLVLFATLEESCIAV